jgi:hypothetical protein
MGVLNEIDIKLLGKLSTYLRASGMKTGLLDWEVDSYDLTMKHMTNFSNNWSVEIPEWIFPTMEKILKHCENRIQFLDDYSYNTFEIEIDAVNKELHANQSYGWYESSDPMVTQWSVKEDDEDKEISGLLSDIRESADEEDDEFELKYNGSGDSGYIESQFENMSEVPSSVEDWVYSQLESLHGGWEINEGSDGSFEFDLKNGTITLRHSYNEEQQESLDLFSIDFGKSN